MQGPLRGCLAGYGAWKLGGGGCLTTVVLFLIFYYLLGHISCH